MSIVVVDYSDARPTPAEMKAAGVHAVGRYFGQAIGQPKNLTLAEAKELAANGIDIISIFEFGAKQATGGAGQAKADIDLARRQRDQVEMPHDRPWYFAVDFDVPDYAPSSNDPLAKLGPIGKYFQEIHATAGTNTGAYGGYYLIKRLFDAGLISWGFQTVAWSGGQRDKRAQLYQTGATAFGQGADVDVPERTDFGQWRAGAAPVKTPAPAPAPHPAPAPQPKPQEGYLVTAGGAGGYTGRAVTSADGGKTWA